MTNWRTPTAADADHGHQSKPFGKRHRITLVDQAIQWFRDRRSRDDQPQTPASKRPSDALGPLPDLSDMTLAIAQWVQVMFPTAEQKDAAK